MAIVNETFERHGKLPNALVDKTEAQNIVITVLHQMEHNQFDNKGYEEYFPQLDTDKDGKISNAELALLCKMLVMRSHPERPPASIQHRQRPQQTPSSVQPNVSAESF